MKNIGKLVYIKPHLISNLTMYQKQLSRSKKFKNWFKESVVFDQFNEPLVMRHGSHIRFDTFKKSPKWIFFCEFKHACNYAKDKFDRIYGGKKTKNHWLFLHECFVSIKNPFYCNREKFRDINVAETWKKGYDGIVAYRTRDADWEYDQYIVKDTSQIWIINSYW